MKKAGLLLFVFLLIACKERSETKIPYSAAPTEATSAKASPDQAKAQVEEVLDQWHQAAAEADFDRYFGYMDENSIYIGTDATENWQLEEFKAFSKPFFDRGRAWDFTALERNIYISEAGDVAWIDELLDTHMGLVRGSGVLAPDLNRNWKIRHYVLSLTVPNDNLEKIKAINHEADSSLIARMRG